MGDTCHQRILWAGFVLFLYFLYLKKLNFSVFSIDLPWLMLDCFTYTSLHINQLTRKSLVAPGN